MQIAYIVLLNRIYIFSCPCFMQTQLLMSNLVLQDTRLTLILLTDNQDTTVFWFPIIVLQGYIKQWKYHLMIFFSRVLSYCITKYSADLNLFHSYIPLVFSSDKFASFKCSLLQAQFMCSKSTVFLCFTISTIVTIHTSLSSLLVSQFS